MELHPVRSRWLWGGWLLLLGAGWLVAGCANTGGPHPAVGHATANQHLRPNRTAPNSGSDAISETAPEKAKAKPRKGSSASAGEMDSPSSSGSGEYAIQPGDEIDIQVYREPDLSGTFRVNSEGEIRHPLLGTVPLAQQTLKEAEAVFTQRLAKDYLVNPRVIIKMVSTQSSQIVLLGEVKNPGVYPLPFGEPMTLLQAIAGAGGFTELASPDRVRIVRRTPDGHQTTIRVRVSELLSGKGGKKDIPLEPNDVITVDQVLF